MCVTDIYHGTENSQRVNKLKNNISLCGQIKITSYIFNNKFHHILSFPSTKFQNFWNYDDLNFQGRKIF